MALLLLRSARSSGAPGSHSSRSVSPKIRWMVAGQTVHRIQPAMHVNQFNRLLDSRGEPTPSATDFFVETRVACVRPRLLPAKAQSATASKKLDLKRRNASSSNRCRLKSGYPSHLLIHHQLKPPSCFRKQAPPNRTSRKTRLRHPTNHPVIPLLHNQHSSRLRRPITIRGNTRQTKQNDALTSTTFFTHSCNFRG